MFLICSIFTPLNTPIVQADSSDSWWNIDWPYRVPVTVEGPGVASVNLDFTQLFDDLGLNDALLDLRSVRVIPYDAGIPDEPLPYEETYSTLIIDAMDLLYTRRFDGFCLVSSDSDFTGLALRIREEGLTVLGFGEQKTPDAFRNACHKFVFTEVLRSLPSESTATKVSKNGAIQKTTSTTSSPKPSSGNENPTKEFPREFILQALEQASDDAGWAILGTFGSYLTKLQPDFDARLYGFKKLSELVKAKTDIFQIEKRKVNDSDAEVLYVRDKQHFSE